jgi:hypothetical protein
VASFVPHRDTVDDLAFSRPPERSPAEQSVFRAQQLVLVFSGPSFQEEIGPSDLEIDDPPDEYDPCEKYERLYAIIHFALLSLLRA